ncbi:PAS domain-containing sensor histidine kinase [Mesorhizobium marinum]|uniref:PAS domain-containing sensor histidine kinase n=1 Tax=Mesorhizobium marinum TaxID=3228790 RepID=UPI00346571DA
MLTLRDGGRTHFVEGGGELGRLIRNHDWKKTPLGPLANWPQSLKSALSICLHSTFPTAIYWGPELRLLYNDAWAPIPGERHPSALGKPGAEVWSDIWDVVGPQFAAVLESGEGFSTFDQLLPMLRNGVRQETYWNYSFTPIHGEDGTVQGVFNQGHETTAQVLARREAEAEIERLGALFELAPSAVAILGGKRHVIEVANAAYESLVGRTDIIGKPIADALPEVVSQGFLELLDRVFDSGEPFVGRAVPVALQRNADAPEERLVDFIYQPFDDVAGTRVGIFVQATDVTEVARAEDALRASEAKYQAIVDSIDQMIWSTRPDGYHDYYNERWYEFTGVPHGSTDGEEWNGMFHPDDQDRAWNIWRLSLATGEPYHIEYRLRHRSGQYRWVIGRAQCVRDQNGNITRWFGTCTDIHALKEAEEKRQLLLREMNHRIKNLFAATSGMVTLTAKNAPSVAAMAGTLRGRLAALAKAHDLVRPAIATEEGLDQKAALDTLVNAVLEPHLDPYIEQQVCVEGPAVALGSSASTSLALVFHELATNAAKYGALAAAGGGVSVRWSVSAETLDLDWREYVRAGDVSEPKTSGFGSTLAKSSIAGQLGGTIGFRWHADGVQVAISVPIDRLER